MNKVRSSGMPGKTQMAWRIENQADSADIFLYDFIGDWGVPAQDFVRELNVLSDKDINLHVNSEGGDVFDALAMYAALKNHKPQVTAYIDALAASAASFVVMAADRIVIAKTASMMIHEAQGLVIGPADDMRKMAALLEDATTNIAEIYADRSEAPVKSWTKAMKAETWYRGEQAVEAGLADEVMADVSKNKMIQDITFIKAVEEAPEGPDTNPAVDYPRLFKEAMEEETIFHA